MDDFWLPIDVANHQDLSEIIFRVEGKAITVFGVTNDAIVLSEALGTAANEVIPSNRISKLLQFALQPVTELISNGFIT